MLRQVRDFYAQARVGRHKAASVSDVSPAVQVTAVKTATARITIRTPRSRSTPSVARRTIIAKVPDRRSPERYQAARSSAATERLALTATGARLPVRSSSSMASSKVLALGVASAPSAGKALYTLVRLSFVAASKGSYVSSCLIDKRHFALAARRHRGGGRVLQQLPTAFHDRPGRPLSRTTRRRRVWRPRAAPRPWPSSRARWAQRLPSWRGARIGDDCAGSARPEPRAATWPPRRLTRGVVAQQLFAGRASRRVRREFRIHGGLQPLVDQVVQPRFKLFAPHDDSPITGSARP